MKRKFIIVTLSIFIAFVCTYTFSGNKLSDSDINIAIKDELIRFHVLANSNSAKDQALKMTVKNSVVNYTKDALSSCENIDQSRSILKEMTPEIKALCETIISDNGYSYPVNIYFDIEQYPEKAYGDVTFPAGEYESYRIEIGDAAGENWWCVMYPPLCFIDASHGVLNNEGKEKLHSVLDDDIYNALVSGNVKFEFKYLTFLNNLF